MRATLTHGATSSWRSFAIRTGETSWLRAPAASEGRKCWTSPGSAAIKPFDVIAAALTPPIVCDAALVTFSLDSFWRGETHRLCDRPAAINRLLEEVAAAGVTQIIVVSAVAPAHEPHRLSAPRLDPRHRLGDYLVAAECAALRDAIEVARLRFDAMYVVSPTHNPLGPFDFLGAYDEASDRHQDLLELMERGYEDAYRQFIEPVVGGSGEHLGRTEIDGLRLSF